MNLLVTGGAGFIGSHFIERAIEDSGIQKLVNLDALTYAGNPANLAAVAGHPRYHFEYADLRDKNAVLRIVRDHAVTHVVHFAAETHVDNSIADPNAFIHTNVTGTFHLLEACKETWNNEPRTKNLFLHVSTPILRCLRARAPIPLYGDGLQIRDWIHVSDHCSALRSLLTSGRLGDVCNIGANNERTNLDLLVTICDLFDEAHPELGGNSRSLITHVTDRPGHDRRYAIDASRLRHRFGWSTSKRRFTPWSSPAPSRPVALT